MYLYFLKAYIECELTTYKL